MLHNDMYLSNSPFLIGKNPGLTEAQKAKQKLDAEWEAIGKPSVEDSKRKEARIVESLKRHFSEGD